MPFDLSSLYGGGMQQGGMDPRMMQLMQMKQAAMQGGMDPGMQGPMPMQNPMADFSRDQRYIPQENHPGFPARDPSMAMQRPPMPMKPQMPMGQAPMGQGAPQAQMRRPMLSSLRPQGMPPQAQAQPQAQRPMPQGGMRRRPMGLGAQASAQPQAAPSPGM